MITTQRILLADQLRSFAHKHREVECCGLISTTGIMMASYHINESAEDKFAAICTANFGLLSRSSRELKGKLEKFTVQIEGKDGYTIISSTGGHTIFIALCRKGVRPQNYLLEQIQQVMEESYQTA